MTGKPGALFGSTHPGPSVAVTVITVALGVAVGLEPLRLAAVGVSMLAGEFSVGFSNDWIDADRDRAAGRLDKPVTRGDVSVGAVRTAAIVTAIISLAAIAPLGWLAIAAMIVAIGMGWAYNAGLKSTPLSVATYFFGFAALPAVATFALVPARAPSVWSLLVGGLLGAAAHFANTLPDLVADEASGVRGLPQLLGRRASVVATYVILLAAAAIELAGTGGFAFLLADLALAATLIIAAIGFRLVSRPTRWHFRLIILAALIDVIVLVFAGQRLLA